MPIAMFRAVDETIASYMMVHIWISVLKWQFVRKFGIMENLLLLSCFYSGLYSCLYFFLPVYLWNMEYSCSILPILSEMSLRIIENRTVDFAG